MTSSWRPNALTTYSATQSNASFATTPAVKFDDLSSLQSATNRDAPADDLIQALRLGGGSVFGRAQHTAKDNLLDILRERTKPDAHQISEAKEALARLRARANEDVDVWAECLAKSSLDLKP